jgi:hypothetical protein
MKVFYLFATLLTMCLSFVPSAFDFDTYKMPFDGANNMACSSDFNTCTTTLGMNVYLLKKASTSYILAA